MQRERLLERRLSDLRRRARLLMAERAALAGCAWAAGLCLVLVALDKSRVLPIPAAYIPALLAGGLACGWACGFARRLSEFEIARVVEARLRLKERLSSAVALQPRAGQDPMVSALMEDAENHLRPVHPARLFPRRYGRRGQVLVGLLALLAAAMILPEIPAFQSKATRRERAIMRREGERLVKLARRLEKRQPPKDLKTRALLKQVAMNMKALGKDMQSARLSRKQALVRLNRLDKQVKLAASEFGASGEQKSLATAAADLKASAEALTQSRLAQRAELLAKARAAREGKTVAGGGQPLTEQQIKELERLADLLKPSQAQQLLNLDADLASVIAELLAKRDTQEALKILKRLADQLQKPETLRKLTPEQLKQLAEEMRRLAEALKNTDLDALAKHLLELARALERGDIKLCRRCAASLGGT